MSQKSNTDDIIFLNRYTGEKEVEKIMAEKAMRWTYGTGLGKFALHTLIKRSIFSKFIGYLKNKPSSAKDILPFINEYGINTDEFLDSIDDFTCFNDFFFRRLKPGSRPMPENPDAVVFPADARHMGWENASQIKNVFVKNQSFDLPALLGDEELARAYAEGTVVLSRLCPTDYHRFHFPCSGIPGESRLIRGSLVSVSPYCLRKRISWLWANKRMLTIIDTGKMGKVAMLEVGATGVGSIIQTYESDVEMKRGDEKGYFAFGGSTVMTFFEPGKVKLCSDLLEATSQQTELFARQGDIMGDLIGQ